MVIRVMMKDITDANGNFKILEVTDATREQLGIYGYLEDTKRVIIPYTSIILMELS